MSRKHDIERRRTIGKNLATARKLAGMSQSDVMVKVWGGDDPRQKNRISEIEHGADTLPDAELLCELCITYGVSADYILGLSVEPEIDMTAGRMGVMYNGLRSTLSEQLESVVMELSRLGATQLANTPKPSMMGIIQAAKDVIREMDQHKRNLPVELVQQIALLGQEVRHCEQQIAVSMRKYEMAVNDIVERPDSIDRHGLITDTSKPERKRYPCTSLPKPIEPKKDSQLSLFVHDGNIDVTPLM